MSWAAKKEPSKFYTCMCGLRHDIPMYAFAQAAMHGRVNHHCACGRKNVMYGSGMVYCGYLPRLVLEAEAKFDAGDEKGSWSALFRAAKQGVLRDAS